MPDSPTDAFLALLEQALTAGTFARLVLSKPRPAAGDLVRVSVRHVALKGEACLSFVHTHNTRDITKNLALAEGVAAVRGLIASTFQQAHLFSADEEAQLMISKKGKQTLLRGKARHEAGVAPQAGHAHGRAKHRVVDLNQPFLVALGVTDAQHQLVPAMARKWKQINKFIEVLDHALASTALKTAPKIDVLDFGSGKGYLTFAMHGHLRHTLGLPARVTGVELREDMVVLCNAAAQRVGASGAGGLHFEHGDVSSHAPQPVDIMIALHACDTATDHAIHTGVRAGAAIIMCSPCCHKELRPQLLTPHPMRPILKHGVHLGQQAEMLTDGLRALMLDACGYDTQVFEFIALEHTNKNKMILAVKRAKPGPADEIWKQVDEIKSFYGIREQCLETLLKARVQAPEAV
ncbi:MAG: SAM-dependent methyltransferase [Bacteriovorax sp.]|nr:SAM-dependent methyltransferase [Rhizobacter sp.]